jgi:titin
MRSGIVRLSTLVTLALMSGGCEDQPLGPDPQPVSLAAGGGLSAPSNLAASGGSATEIHLGWRDNSPNETGFEVHWSTTGADGVFSLRSTTGPNVTNYDDRGLTHSTQYCYRLRVFKKTGKTSSYSAFSPTACATTPGPPAAPSNTNAMPPSSSAIDVTWKDNSTSETGFRLERSATPVGPWLAIAELGVNLTSYRDGERSAEQTVCYRVIAFNAHGASDASVIDCTAPPASPTNPVATSADNTSIDFTWADNSSVEDGHEVHRTSWDGTDITINLPPNSTSYHDTDVIPEAPYRYGVRAKKDGGYSDFAFSNFVTIVTAPPPPPDWIVATPSDSRTVLVYWNNPSPTVDGYRIERSTDGGASWTTAGSTATEYWFYDEGRLSEQLVCYRVFAFNSKGESPPSVENCTTPPLGPTDLRSTVVDDQTIELHWTNHSAVADGYEVWIATGEDFYPIVTLPQDATSAGVPRYYGFQYAVAATKDGGYSDFVCCVASDGSSTLQSGALRVLRRQIQKVRDMVKVKEMVSKRDGPRIRR